MPAPETKPPSLPLSADTFNAIRRCMHRALLHSGLEAWEDVAVLQAAMADAKRRADEAL